MDLLEVIPTSKEKAITRQELSLVMGANDRDNRFGIEALRKQGHNIIPTPKGGYYITDDIDELETFLKSIDSRMTSMYLTYLPMRKQVANARGIKITNVRQHFRRLGVDIVENQMSMFGG